MGWTYAAMATAAASLEAATLYIVKVSFFISLGVVVAAQ